MSDFHFLRPWWLVAIVPAACVAWRLWSAEDGGRVWRKLVAPHLLPRLLVGHEDRSWFRPVSVLLVTWILFAIALAGPTWQREPAPFAEDTAALVIVLKVTPSMKSEDVQPTRQARAAEKIRDLLKLRPGAKTSLFAYAGSVHRVMPLTGDAGIVSTLADELSAEVMPVEGSQANAAIAAADEAVRKSGQSGWILWIADSATDSEMKALEGDRPKRTTPVSVLAVAGEGPELDTLKRTATAIDAQLVRVTPDDSDVRQLAANAKFSNVGEQAGGDRWRDFGYWLVWPLAGLTLLGFRRGWTIRLTRGA